MTTHLLDVNLLMALTDPLHVHHEGAHRWFTHASESWSSCPITENGFVRILSHPRYPNSPGNATIVLEMLGRFCALAGHVFWDKAISLRDWVEPGAAITHTQVTDLYLLALAAHHGGKLATFDRQIQAGLVRGGVHALEVLTP